MDAKRSGYLVISAFLMAVFVSPVLKAADISGGPKEISNLFSETRIQALQLQGDAEEMQAFLSSKLLSPATHTSQIMTVKVDVNQLVETVNRLNRARSTGSGWQQTAIDRITPVLRALAANIQATIDHLNEHRAEIENCVEMDPRYRQHITTTTELATKLAALTASL